MTQLDALRSADPARHFQPPDPEHMLAAARLRAGSAPAGGARRSRAVQRLLPAGIVTVALAASAVVALPGAGTVQTAQARLQRAVAATIAVDSGRVVTDITGGGATVHHELLFSGARSNVTQDTRSPGFHQQNEARTIDGMVYTRKLPDGEWSRLPLPPQIAANRDGRTVAGTPVVDATALRTLLERAADVRRVAGANGAESYAATVDQAAFVALRDRPLVAYEDSSGSASMQVRMTVGADGLLHEVRTESGDAVTTVRYLGLGEPQEVPGPPALG